MNATVKNNERIPERKTTQRKAANGKGSKLSDLKAEINTIKSELETKTLQLNKLQTKNKEMEKGNQKLTEIKDLITNADHKNTNIVDVIKMYIERTEGFDDEKTRIDREISILRQKLDDYKLKNEKLEQQLKEVRTVNEDLEFKYQTTVKDQNNLYNDLLESYGETVEDYVMESENFLKGFGKHS